MNLLPLYPNDVFGFPTGLLLGTLVGFAFGFVLERAGFGNAKNLAAQFYLTDTRVLKVMFSAIATACAGIGLLSGLGVLDLSLLTVPETFVGPHVVGGLLLGIGFMVSAYCPGTGVVAMASGKWDGFWSIVGVTAGSFLFGLFYGPLEGFYKSGAMGSVTIAQATGLPFSVLAAGVVAMAIGAFLGAEKLELIFARRAGKDVPPSNDRLRNRQFAALGALAVLAQEHVHSHERLDALGGRGLVELHQREQVALVGDRHGRHAEPHAGVDEPLADERAVVLLLAVDAHHAVDQRIFGVHVEVDEAGHRGRGQARPGERQNCTGAKLRRCTGDGPRLRNAATCAAVG